MEKLEVVAKKTMELADWRVDLEADEKVEEGKLVDFEADKKKMEEEKFVAFEMEGKEEALDIEASWLQEIRSSLHLSGQNYSSQ